MFIFMIKEENETGWERALGQSASVHLDLSRTDGEITPFDTKLKRSRPDHLLPSCQGLHTVVLDAAK